MPISTAIPSIIPHSDALFRSVRTVAPYARHLTCRIKREDVDMEIGSFLMRRLPFRSLSDWKQRLHDGLILQGDIVMRPGMRLQLDPPLVFFTPAQTEPSVPDEVAILEDTADYLLAYKPAPMPVHPGGRYNRNALTSILKKQIKVLHRLDSVTSGLMLFGRSRLFSQRVRQAFSNGDVEKSYLAVVSGNPDEDRITIAKPIRRKEGYIFECALNGKASITGFEVLMRGRSAGGARAALVECRPVTGRTHQIRLHLREWGHPVIDDPLYGVPTTRIVGTDSFPMQNRGISLLHYALHIPRMGLSFDLADYSSIPELSATITGLRQYR